MAKSISKGSSFLSYIWSFLMLICIVLLTVHLAWSAKTTIEKNGQLIKKTYTTR